MKDNIFPGRKAATIYRRIYKWLSRTKDFTGALFRNGYHEDGDSSRTQSPGRSGYQHDIITNRKRAPELARPKGYHNDHSPNPHTNQASSPRRKAILAEPKSGRIKPTFADSVLLPVSRLRQIEKLLAREWTLPMSPKGQRPKKRLS